MMSEADKEDAYRSQALQAGKAPSTSEIKCALAAAGGSLDRALAAAGYPPLLPPPSKAVTEVVEAQAYAPFTSLRQEADRASDTIPVTWHGPTTLEARSRSGRLRGAADEEECSEECFCAATRKVLMAAAAVTVISVATLVVGVVTEDEGVVENAKMIPIVFGIWGPVCYCAYRKTAAKHRVAEELRRQGRHYDALVII